MWGKLLLIRDDGINGGKDVSGQPNLQKRKEALMASNHERSEIYIKQIWLPLSYNKGYIIKITGSK